MRGAMIGAFMLVAGLALGGCASSAVVGSLPPSLTMTSDAGPPVALQNGIPVPSFSWQPRPRIELDGAWRMVRAELDPTLTMSDRGESLAGIEAEAAGRQAADYDDGAWTSTVVPGTMNPPPDGKEGGAWYRRTFDVPAEWAGRAVTVRFGSANYVADVWLNGTWLGYHEGGHTPFAFDLGTTLQPGAENVLAVRVHTIPLGTRTDTVPWGIIDWWNYGGLTGPVWLEATPPLHLVRADVTPHLDAVDVTIVLRGAQWLAGGTDDGEQPPEVEEASLRVSILPASVDEENLLDPDPRTLVPDLANELAVATREVSVPDTGSLSATEITFDFADADAWTPAVPALYVLRVELLPEDQEPLDAREAVTPDALWSTFGIRHVAVDPAAPRVLLNGEPVFFRGVGLHAESLTLDAEGELAGGTPHQRPEEILAELRDARTIGADLLRTGHLPGDPTMLMLADRLGFAVWEEIPLYHATPLTFRRAMDRGIAQQMLREMALRDMNHPSVLFHGLANESTGTDERTDALAELHEVDREIDGTRLTGQAAYGWQPMDPTHAPLDVAGFTFYYGVFYGDDAGIDTRRALREAHEMHPDKPILALEFGRWADEPIDEERQLVIFEETFAALQRYRADVPGGFVSAATWWTLHDFATQITGIGIEHFGLFRPDGSLRPAGEAAADRFGSPAGIGSALGLEPDLDRARPVPAPGLGDWTLLGYLAYGIGLSITAMGAAIWVLTRRGGRATGRAAR
ncbi:MAG: sugar-binding domain-containing protein [Candidatus Limnocylindria bacterium]